MSGEKDEGAGWALLEGLARDLPGSFGLQAQQALEAWRAEVERLRVHIRGLTAEGLADHLLALSDETDRLLAEVARVRELNGFIAESALQQMRNGDEARAALKEACALLRRHVDPSNPRGVEDEIAFLAKQTESEP